MDRRARWAILALVPLLIGACTSNADPRDPGERESEASGTPLSTGVDVCSLADQEPVAAAVVAHGLGAEPAEPFEHLSRETFVTCTMTAAGMSEPVFSWAVRDPALVSVPEFDDLRGSLDQRPDEVPESEELDVNGVEAQLLTAENRAGTLHLQIGFEHEGLQVLVAGDRLSADRPDVDARADVLGIAEQVHESLDGQAPDPVDLGSWPCPEPTDPRLVAALGAEPSVARAKDDLIGHPGFTCQYANDEFSVWLRVAHRAADAEDMASITPDRDQKRSEYAGEAVRVFFDGFEQTGAVMGVGARCNLSVSHRANGASYEDPAVGPAESEGYEALQEHREEMAFALLEAWHETTPCEAADPER